MFWIIFLIIMSLYAIALIWFFYITPWSVCNSMTRENMTKDSMKKVITFFEFKHTVDKYMDQLHYDGRFKRSVFKYPNVFIHAGIYILEDRHVFFVTPLHYYLSELYLRHKLKSK